MTIKKVKKVTEKMVREHLGHNGQECRVVIHRDGRISRYGHPDPTNRSMDFWHSCAGLDEQVKELLR